MLPLYYQLAIIGSSMMMIMYMPSTSSPVRQKKVRDAKYGRRKDGEHPFKAIPRRPDFVVFNVPQDCSVDTIKSYIPDNGVQVIDIRRL